MPSPPGTDADAQRIHATRTTAYVCGPLPVLVEAAIGTAVHVVDAEESTSAGLP